MGVTTYSKETALYDKGKVHDSIADAGKTANNYVTDITNAGIFVHHNDGGNHTAPTAPNARGVKISDTVDIIRDGKVMAEFGGGDGDEITLGNEEIGDYIVKVNSTGSNMVRADGDVEDVIYSYRAHETTGLITYEEPSSRFYYNSSLEYNFVMSRFTISALSSVLYAGIIVNDEEIPLVRNGQLVDSGYYIGVYSGRLYITRATFETLTGHGEATLNDKIRIRYRANGTIYSTQMWLGNAVPKDDIRLQVAKDDNTPGFTVDKDGSIASANIDSGTSEEVAIANGSNTTVTVTFGKEFPSVPKVVCSLTQIKNTDNPPKLTDVHQLVVQITAVGLNSASFSIRNNGTLNRRAKISWMAFAN